MAEVNPPLWQSSQCYTAVNDRQHLSSLVCSEGVDRLTAGSLLVTAQGSPNMTVNVAAGNAFIAGEDVAEQGMYHVFSDGIKVVAITAADGVNPRIDRIVATVRDAQYAGANNDWLIQAITGTPAGSPSAPAEPLNSITLALISVPAGDTTISSGQITDARVNYTLCKDALGSTGLLATQVFTAGGTFTKASYPTAKAIRVRAVAGGGGGGGAATTAGSKGGGGGGGSYGEKLIQLSALATSETVTIGGGGAGGVGGVAGAVGVASSFGAHLTTLPGAGGSTTAGFASTTNPGSGGAIGAGGDLAMPGADGGPGWAISAVAVVGGKGGDSQLGQGGRELVLVAGAFGGLAPKNYGAGGGGAGTFVGGVAQTGADGSPGVIIVEIYG